MIKQLTVRNFQCHGVFEQHLSPGVNVFVGKSGIGKSAGVVRPLRLLAFNRPLGESYRRWGSNETEVTVELDSGVEVSRLKSNKDNLYRLGIEVFRSFGQQPPEAVQEALNLGEINFQFQHDPIFLLSMSPAELARTLNEVAGLDQIDTAFSRINSRLRREKQEIATAETLKNKLEEEVGRYKDLDQLEVQVNIIEELDSRSRSAYARGEKLEYIADKLEKTKEQVNRYKGLDELEKTDITMQHIMEGVLQFKAEHDLLNDLADRWDTANQEIDRFKPLDKLDIIVSSLYLLSTNIQAKQKEWRELEAMADRIERAELMLMETEKELSETREQFHSLMPEVCPLCGTLIKINQTRF